MRPPRLLLAALVLPAALALSGCSEHSSRVVGNERLIRGPGGLGTTVIQGPAVDRDTYVTPGTANLGSTLLVGRSASYEARAFFKFIAFSLPDTNLPGLVPGDVLFELPPAPLRLNPLDLQLDFGITDAALADSGVISWPGPGMGTPLGSIQFDFTGPLLLSMGPGSFFQFKQWALDPSLAPAFILRAPLTQGMAGFRAGAARFRVPYTWNNGGTTVVDTTSTTVFFDLYLHPPISPTPTGADTAIVLGGGFEASMAIRAPVPAIPPGASVNELRLVLAVIDSLPGVDGSILHEADDSTRVAVTLEVRQISSVWPEGATDASLITTNVIPISLVLGVTAAAGDSLSIRLPTSLARGWSANPVSNEGVLITILSANTNPGIVIGSRESSRPPVLRVGTTSPPPGKF